MKTSSLYLNKIDRKAGTQIRVRINQEVVDEYAECMKNGDRFPPVVVFKCKEGRNVHYILADGFHRCLAADQNKHKTITCEIIEGNERDALKYALKANSAHGLRRTNRDKRNAVLIALKDEEWEKYSNHEIARLCAVSEFLVRTVRKEITSTIKSQKEKKALSTIKSQTQRKFKRGGKILSQNISNIGKSNQKRELDTFDIFLKKTIEEVFSKTQTEQLKRFTSKSELDLDLVLKRAVRKYLE